MKTQFKLNGKPLDLRPAAPSVTKAKPFLQSLPDNELLSSRELAIKIGVSYATVKDVLAIDEALIRFTARLRLPRKTTVWGNPRTIAELSKNKELLA